MSSPVQAYYRVHAHIYDLTRRPFLPGRELAVQRLELRPDSTVVEIGCGTGLNFPLLLRHLDPARGRLIGVDFSAAMLKRARRRVAAAGWPHIELLEADATSLSLPVQADAILFSYSLAMIPAWRETLARAAALLAPDGRLVVLDFGDLSGWGPLGAVLRAWLRLNHVAAGRPFATRLRELFREVSVDRLHGGYCSIACGRGPQVGQVRP